jgi:hypothetical protein
VRDEQAGGTAVHRFERLAVVLVRDPRLTIGDVGEGEVGRIAAVAERQGEVGRSVDICEQDVDGDAPPRGVELGPLGDAVDVGIDLFAGEGEELLPRPRRRLVDRARDSERPFVV